MEDCILNGLRIVVWLDVSITILPFGNSKTGATVLIIVNINRGEICVPLEAARCVSELDLIEQLSDERKEKKNWPASSVACRI